MGGATLARRHAANNVGAVVDHFLSVKGADAASEALDQDRGIFVDKNCHCVFLPDYAAFLAAATALAAASASVSALMTVRPL